MQNKSQEVTIPGKVLRRPSKFLIEMIDKVVGGGCVPNNCHRPGFYRGVIPVIIK